MNLFYGEIVAQSVEDGMRTGKICVRGAIKKISLDLLIESQIGDRVLVCDDVAIGQVSHNETTEVDYVSGNSGKAS
jgi:hydrogenase maturation factor